MKYDKGSKLTENIRLKEAVMDAKRIVWLIIIMAFITALALTASMSFAGRGGPGSGGWGMGSAYQRMYNPASVETMSGTVEAIDRTMPMRGMAYGVHLILKTDKETIPVHLGPGWYIERQDIQLKKGDQVEVKGSRINYQGKPAIIAAEIKKDGHLLVLRDAQGVPAWTGWRR